MKDREMTGDEERAQVVDFLQHLAFITHADTEVNAEQFYLALAKRIEAKEHHASGSIESSR